RYERDGEAIPAISASASRNEAGELLVTICNLHPTADSQIGCDLRGVNVGRAAGRVLTSDSMNAHNTFESPDAVSPEAFNAFELADGRLRVTMPAKSVVSLKLS
ncbi:MAG TPA: alpha-L-arabinofuranosidase C-terminal domain-containing protein, partial [Spirochaetia bacterium]|nr:alpha-L-arabinofuranosidase C-terminal domain-containing protein [Spirochaetia bacterium]